MASSIANIVAKGLLVLTLALSAACSDPKDEMRDALAMFERGNVTGSLEKLRDLVAEDPDDPELLVAYGQVLVAAGQPGGAEWPLRKAMQDPEWFERAAIQVANAAMVGANYDNAAAVLQEVLDANPENLEARIMRANACAGSPRLLDEALEEVDRILDEHPDESRAYKPLILSLLGKNQEELAGEKIDELGELIAELDEEDPIRGWHCATRAIFANDSGDAELAAERWAECEKQYPTHPNVVEQSLQFHNSRGEYAIALEVAQAAFEGDPEEEKNFRPVVADLLRILGRADEAEALLIEGTESDDPENQAKAWYALASHRQAMNDWEGSARALERHIELKELAGEVQPNILFALADVYTQIGEFDNALDLANRMTVAPHRTLIRARVAQLQKRYAKAIELFEETTRLWPENAFAAYHSAHSAMAIGDFDRALDDFFLSIRTDEEATDARSQAAKLLAAEGRYETALEVLTKAARAMPQVVGIVALSRGTEAAWNTAVRLSQTSPQQFGDAISVAVMSTLDRRSADEAFALARRALESELDRRNEVPVLAAALLSAQTEEDWRFAESKLDALIEANPDALDAAHLDAIRKDRRGRTDEAIARFREVTEKGPRDANARLRLARLLTTQAPDEAVELIQSAIALERIEPGIAHDAIRALPNETGVDTKISLLEGVLEIEPTSAEISLTLARMLDASETSSGSADQQKKTAARVLHLARRAVRFQGGQEAKDFLKRAQAAYAPPPRDPMQGDPKSG